MVNSGNNQPPSAEQWTVFATAHREHGNITAAARLAGFSRATGMRALKRPENFPLYRRAAEIAKGLIPEGVKDYTELSYEAQNAVADFGYFRERYLGRVAVPWATYSAEVVAEKLVTPFKEFILVNEPPGVGKSTFWTLDLPAWLTCRDRTLRGQIGSSAQSTAENYVQQLRREFEREVPAVASEDDKRKGLAIDATATLIADFGGFKPPRGEPWTTTQFVVKQVGDFAKTNREPTWRALGRDTKFLGWRGNFLVWDDLVDRASIATAESREALAKFWVEYAETRLEPGGVCVLQGQRLHAEDLYKFASNIEVTEYNEDEDSDGWGEPIGKRKKYFHLSFKDHYQDRCVGDHNPRKAKPFDPHRPNDSGCLLDPRRLTYRDLMAVKDQDPRVYRVLYQQEDIDPTSVLVNPLWVSGGVDLETGEEFLGCWNRNRMMASVAVEIGEETRCLPKGITRPWLSYVTADPSPTKFWSVQWWLYHFASERRFLLDHARRKMDGDDFVTNIIGTHDYAGLLEDWWLLGKRLGAPITHVIMERNAAQRWLMTDKAAKGWREKRRVTYVPHDTHAQNKSHAQLGVSSLIPPVWRHGLIDLPSADQTSRGRAMALVNEVTHYPESSTTDCVMAQWFGEFNLPNLRRAIDRPAQPPVMQHRVMTAQDFANLAAMR